MIKRTMMMVTGGLVMLGVASHVNAVTVSKLLEHSGAIHSSGNRPGDTTDYYGSGNDDNFAEYGIATFNFTSSDFGDLVNGINSVNYTLTHNDRSFTDGSELEFFLTTDDFSSAYSGLSYDNSGANNPSGLNQSQYSNITSLGTFPYSEKSGGTKEVFTLNLTGAQQTALINEINSGSNFSIVITATALNADVTFTGDDDTFEPGGQPVLEIDASLVPEPASLALLGMGGLMLLRRRKA